MCDCSSIPGFSFLNKEVSSLNKEIWSSMTQNDGSGSCSSCRRSVVVYTTDSTGAVTAACTHDAVVVFIICGGYSWLYDNPGNSSACVWSWDEIILREWCFKCCLQLSWFRFQNCYWQCDTQIGSAHTDQSFSTNNGPKSFKLHWINDKLVLWCTLQPSLSKVQWNIFFVAVLNLHSLFLSIIMQTSFDLH